jgi:hypothetical protein
MFNDTIKLLVSIGMIFGFTYVLSDSIIYSFLSIFLVIVAYRLTLTNGIYISNGKIIIIRGLLYKTKRNISIENLSLVTKEYLYTTSLTSYCLVFHLEENEVQFKYEVFSSDYTEIERLTKFLEEHNISYREI